MLYLFYVTKYVHVIHTLASHLWDKQGNWGQSGVDVSRSAGYAVCDGNMSSYPAGGPAGSCILLVSSFFFFFFFVLLLSSSFFWQHIFFTHFPTSDFNQTCSQWPVPWPLLRHRQWWGQRSRWGHWGQKGHFHQKGIKSYRILSIDAWLMHMNTLDPLYKSYGPKNSSGVIWGHGGQKVIFTKKASSPSEYVALTRYLCICISLINSTKVMVLKIHPGSFGVTGVKRSFSLKML